MLPVLLTLAASAGEPVEIDVIGQARPRFEVRRGEDGPATALTQRTRLGAEARWSQASGQVVLQDVRAWGAAPAKPVDVVARAWMAWTPHKEIKLTVGRQAIAFHDQRIFGGLDWAQQGRNLDAIRLDLGKKDAVSATGVAARLSTGEAGERWILSNRAGVQLDKAQVEFIYLGEVGDDPSRHTAGFFGIVKGDVVSGRGEAYVQGGTSGPVGWLLAAEARIKPDVKTKPVVKVGADVLSSGDGEKGRAFTHPFGTNHLFYGLADVMFFKRGAAADGDGLADTYAKASAKLAPITVGAELHHFRETRTGGMLGTEADAWVKAPLAKGIGLFGGGAILAGPDVPLQGWGFIQLNAAFKAKVR